MYFLNRLQKNASLMGVAFFLWLGVSTSGLAANAAQASISRNFVSPEIKLLWQDLSVAQRTSLKPLANDWNTISESQRLKWLEIANKYPSMKPDEQNRIQDRMRSWVKLSPAQRTAARENFALSNKITPEVKSAKWQQYQQLSDAEKKQLAEQASQKKKLVTNIPTTDERKLPPLKPLKTGPKPAQNPQSLPSPHKQVPANTSTSTDPLSPSNSSK